MVALNDLLEQGEVVKHIVVLYTYPFISFHSLKHALINTLIA
jgi:hypothetical protein